MKSAFIESTGSSEIIQVAELPLPVVMMNQALIEVKASCVDPVDTYIRSGKYKVELPFPFIIGRDMIGTVRLTGSRVSRFKPGDVVWCNNQGYGGRQGTFAEFISVDEELLYHLPTGISELNALASLHSALTSVVALKGKAELLRGQTIFIRGGSGNVGINGIQLAKSIGARVIVTAGSGDKETLCRQAGADAIVNYKRDDLVSTVKSLVPDGLDVYWDLTPRPDVQMALKLVAHRGRILLSSGLTQDATFNVGEFYTKNCTMFGFTITDLNTAELSRYAEVINEELKKETFKSEIAKIVPLSEAASAHALVEHGSVAGKVIVQIGRSPID